MPFTPICAMQRRGAEDWPLPSRVAARRSTTRDVPALGGAMRPQPGIGRAIMQPMYPGMPWMPQVAPMRGVPRGLEYLTQLDQVWTSQTKDMLEMVLPWEVSNSYRIFNSYKQQCYYAFEQSDVFSRQACGNQRPFRMIIADNMGQLIFTVDRPFQCCKELLCNDEVKVASADGRLLGSVNQTCSCQSGCCNGAWEISDSGGRPRFTMEGPCCDCTACTGTTDFKICSLGSSEPIGKISKEWSGIISEAFTDADNFGVYFPIDLEVEMKATFIGATFLIDFMLYEKEDRKDSPFHRQEDRCSHDGSGGGPGGFGGGGFGGGGFEMNGMGGGFGL